MKLNHKSEAEMQETASEMAETIVIRTYDNGSSIDERRQTTPEEKAALEEIFYGAMLTLNHHKANVSNDIIQAVKDMAEFYGDVRIPGMNGYDSVYIPLQKYVDENKEKEHKLER